MVKMLFRSQKITMFWLSDITHKHSVKDC